MSFVRSTRLAALALIALAASRALAQDPTDPGPPPLYPETIVSHVVDGPTPDGARSRATIFTTNVGGAPVGADVVFVPDSGEPGSVLGIAVIVPGATVPVEVRDVVGADAPDLVTGTVRVRFHAAPPPPDDPDRPPLGPPAGFVAAYVTRAFDPARFPGAPPQTIPLHVGQALRLVDHPPCPPPPCEPPPPPPRRDRDLPPCPPDHPCPDREHRCRPAEGTDCPPPPPPGGGGIIGRGESDVVPDDDVGNVD